MAKDPVCGMDIEADQAVASYEYKGKIYYFCAEGCKNKFAKNPEEFINE
ncbi:YHS domain-containing protein [Halanaerobium sp. ST460_2HS_T2]|jgi:Cu+-exporting ATPase|nr:YHS domain-containing protein [Halanaerobium sp. ST460_2HS_T2]RCW58328.1 YHS domain-containing protein [Halanaerobium sp. ST460_2HS_T2]